ncbi:MAG: carboxymuconolactone decarboxylase family protein [Actinomycetota bacterium]|nr:carboxymuconolactone decarboxylase family protein [Actinomycetota bacterium]
MTDSTDAATTTGTAPDGTQAQRRRKGVDLLTTLSGLDPADAAKAERMASGMERRHGALGSFAVDHVLGNLWSRPQLSRRDRSMIVVAFLATIGSTEELEAHVNGALNHGLSEAEVREVVNQVAGYAGFPMAMAATRIVDAVVMRRNGLDRLPDKEAAASLDDDARARNATDVLGTLFGGRTSTDPANAKSGTSAALGGVGELAFEFAFGELWSRNELSRRDRSMITVAILGMLKAADELAIHVPGALNHGVTREEVEEVMVQLTVYGGFPRAVEGIKAARAAFAKIDARAASGR